jgi:glycosyl hydrolase family 5
VFTFVYRPDRAITAPTEISIPPRAYPMPPTVDCGGCRFEIAAGRVRILAPAEGEQVTVTIRSQSS